MTSYAKMLFVPWRYIADWRCIACGQCCKAYSVVLNFQEWLRIVKNYGVEMTVSGLNKLFIKRRSDGSCAFLRSFSNLHLCGLQHMKPNACKIWPFKVLGRPKFGYANDALYYYGGGKLYVYADPTCVGLKYGSPSWEFANYTLREFVELALGLRSDQRRTKANLNFFNYTPRKII